MVTLLYYTNVILLMKLLTISSSHVVHKKTNHMKGTEKMCTYIGEYGVKLEMW